MRTQEDIDMFNHLKNNTLKISGVDTICPKTQDSKCPAVIFINQ
jgi:hypothetical protein